MNEHYNNNDDDDEKILPKWFCLPYCDDCEKHREFVTTICSDHRSHRLLVTCNFCQKDFKTINNRHLTCSSCCRLIEQFLKTHSFEKLEKIPNVFNTKRRRRVYIKDDLIQKVESYFLQYWSIWPKSWGGCF